LRQTVPERAGSQVLSATDDMAAEAVQRVGRFKPLVIAACVGVAAALVVVNIVAAAMSGDHCAPQKVGYAHGSTKK
jgi:hypothetical protein